MVRGGEGMGAGVSHIETPQQQLLQDELARYKQFVTDLLSITTLRHDGRLESVCTQRESEARTPALGLARGKKNLQILESPLDLQFTVYIQCELTYSKKNCQTNCSVFPTVTVMRSFRCRRKLMRCDMTHSYV